MVDMDEPVRATRCTKSAFGDPDQPGAARRAASDLERARSSTHAATHGLKAVGLVLPGESSAAYARVQREWFTSLPSCSPAEAHVVHQLADLAWRQRRLLRLEHALHLDALENAVKKTQAHADYSTALAGLTALNAMVANVGQVAQLRPFPARLGLKPLALACQGAMSLVRDVESVPPGQVKRATDAIEAMLEAAEDGKVKPAHVEAVLASALEIQAVLVQIAKHGEAAVELLREQLAGEVVPDGPRAKMARRYRGEIEKSQQRLLGILGELRVQRQAAEAALEASGGKAIDVRLRVVR